MSITLTIYDLFGNIVPGLLYLYVINETLIAFRQSFIDTSQLDKAYNLVLVLAAAYILGHLCNYFTHDGWYKLFFRKSTKAAALKRVQEQFPEGIVQFSPPDTGALFGLIRQHIPETTHSIEVFRANALMCRNISLGLALFSFLQIALIFQEPVSWGNHLLLADMGIVFSALALLKAKQDRRFFYEGVFTAALNFGGCLEEVISTTRKLTDQGSSKKVKDGGKQDEFE